MKQFITESWTLAVLLRMFIFKMVLSIFAIIFVAIQTVLSPVVWTSLSGQEKFVMVIGILTLCCLNVSAFLDKTAGQLASGQLFESQKTPLNEQKENG